MEHSTTEMIDLVESLGAIVSPQRTSWIWPGHHSTWPKINIEDLSNYKKIKEETNLLDKYQITWHEGVFKLHTGNLDFYIFDSRYFSTVLTYLAGMAYMYSGIDILRKKIQEILSDSFDWD